MNTPEQLDNLEEYLKSKAAVEMLSSSILELVYEIRFLQADVLGWCKFRGQLRGILSPLWPNNPGVSNEEVLGVVRGLVEEALRKRSTAETSGIATALNASVGESGATKT